MNTSKVAVTNISLSLVFVVILAASERLLLCSNSFSISASFLQSREYCLLFQDFETKLYIGLHMDLLIIQIWLDG